jgi:hypothetical protein
MVGDRVLLAAQHLAGPEGNYLSGLRKLMHVCICEQGRGKGGFRASTVMGASFVVYDFCWRWNSSGASAVADWWDCLPLVPTVLKRAELSRQSA